MATRDLAEFAPEGRRRVANGIVVTDAQGDLAVLPPGSAGQVVGLSGGAPAFTPADGTPATPATETFVATEGQTDFVLEEPPVAGTVLAFDNGAFIVGVTLAGSTVTFAVGRSLGHAIDIHYAY